jgi:hypothetical protein
MPAVSYRAYKVEAMKFAIGDKIDQALTTTLAHELILCKDSFERFSHFAKINIMGRRDKIIKIKCHDAYSSFLHHLYEFYVGCIKRNRASTENIDNETLDKILNHEAIKLLKNRIHAIENGYAPSWENDIAVYRIEVPDEFGLQFRKIRNRTAHASIRRSVPGTEMTIATFYQKYHLLIWLLYYSAQCLWTVEDVAAHDWKAIEEFDLAIQG